MQNKKTEVRSVSSSFLPGFLHSFRNQAIFLLLIGVVFYSNTIWNEYAVDDTIVITKNEFVQNGLSGIPDIFSKDSFAGYLQQYKQENTLAGGRYRPLSLATFAIEQQFFGDSPNFRHLVNVVLFFITIVVFLYLLSHFILKDKPEVAFLAVLFFTIHPIHTEVVANIKSRDELLSLLFILLTFIFAIQWLAQKNIYKLVWGLLCFFLALLSKEWGILLIILLPVSFYIILKYDFKQSLLKPLPFVGIGLLFLLIRFSIVNSGSGAEDLSILNNPFALATIAQAFATKIFILLKYLKLLFIPYPLVCDYTYRTIPYQDFGSILVWISILIYTGMIILDFILIRRRHILGFAILFYLTSIALVSNLFISIGATMGERLIYHATVGFCLVMAWLFIEFLKKVKKRQSVLLLFLFTIIPLILIFGGITIARNAQWKNDKTLYLHDVQYLPDNMMVNEIAGTFYIDMFEKDQNNTDSLSRFTFLDKADFYLHRAVNVYGGYYRIYVNMGITALYKKNYELTEYYWNKADSLFPRSLHGDYWKTLDTFLSTAYNDRGFAFYNQKRYSEAMSDYNRAIHFDSTTGKPYNNIGVLLAVKGDYTGALANFNKAITLNPDFIDAYRNRGMARMLLHDMEGARSDWSKAAASGDEMSGNLLKQYFK